MKSLPKLYNVVSLDNGHIDIHYRRHAGWLAAFIVFPLSFLSGVLVSGGIIYVMSLSLRALSESTPNRFEPYDAIFPAAMIIAFLLGAIGAYFWLIKKLVWRDAVIEVRPNHSITFGDITLQRQELKKLWVQKGLGCSVMVSSGGREFAVAGPVRSMALAEVLRDEIINALDR